MFIRYYNAAFLFFIVKPRLLILCICLYNEKVFIGAFHQILFPGIFFQCFRAVLQVVQFCMGVGNSLRHHLLTVFKLIQLVDSADLKRDVIFVEKQHPYCKCNPCKQVFIPDNFLNVFQKSKY